jgi:hypothetical protein
MPNPFVAAAGAALLGGALTGGGVSGKTETRSEIPAYVEGAGKDALNLANLFGRMGTFTNPGPVVAAPTEAGKAAMKMAGNKAYAVGGVDSGFDVLAGMPQGQQFDVGGGQMVNAFSAQPLIDAAIKRLGELYPDQYRQYMAQFAQRFPDQEVPAYGDGSLVNIPGTPGYDPNQPIRVPGFDPSRITI